LHEKSRVTYSFRELDLDARGFGPGDMLKVHRRPREHFDSAFQNASRGARARPSWRSRASDRSRGQARGLRLGDEC
jgi:hypothetical protein